MNDLDWKILLELYKTKNITKAANRLYMTQPALTKRLKQIEAQFQVKIVMRTTKGVEFTEEGEYLSQKAQDYMYFMNNIHRELRDIANQEKTIIILGSSYTFSKRELPDILLHYTLQNPNVTFDVQIEQSNLLFRKVCDGDLDAAFIRGDYEGPVESGRVGEYRGYILTRHPIRIQDILDMDRISFRTNDQSLAIINGWWQEKFGTEPPIGANIGYIDGASQVIAHGDNYYMIAFLPEDYENTCNLELTPLLHQDGSPVVRNTWFVYKKRREMSQALVKFLSYVEDNVVVEM